MLAEIRKNHHLLFENDYYIAATIQGQKVYITSSINNNFSKEFDFHEAEETLKNEIINTTLIKNQDFKNYTNNKTLEEASKLNYNDFEIDNIILKLLVLFKIAVREIKENQVIELYYAESVNHVFMNIYENEKEYIEEYNFNKKEYEV